MPPAEMPPQLDRLWAWLYPCAAVVLLALLLRHHFLIVSALVPLDYYEGSNLLITAIIAAGDNPFTRDFQPAAMSVYPPLYNVLVAPLTWVFDNTLQLHRLVSALFIVISCWICGRIVLLAGASWRHALAAAATLYAALLFYVTPVASANALGVCLYLSIIYLPWKHRYSNASLALACVLAVLVFYVKQYFILAMAMLCLYLFVYQSMRRALLLGCAFALLLAGSLLLVYLTSPYYLDNTLFSPAAAFSLLRMASIAHLQFSAFAGLYWPLLLILLLWMTWRIYLQGWQQALRDLLAAWRPRSGAQAGDRRIFWFCLAWSSLVVFFYLGRNPGNYLSYLFQLISPFLIISFFSLLALEKKLAILAPLVVVCFYQVYALLPDDFSTTGENWRRVDQLVADNEDILASQMLVATLLKHGRAVEQDGHTFYFPLAVNKPKFLLKANPEDRVEAVWEEYITGIYRKIEAAEYDLIMVTPWDGNGIFNHNPPPFSDLGGMAFLRKYYYLDETLALSMTERHGGRTHSLRIWRPLPRSHIF